MIFQFQVPFLLWFTLRFKITHDHSVVVVIIFFITIFTAGTAYGMKMANHIFGQSKWVIFQLPLKNANQVQLCRADHSFLPHLAVRKKTATLKKKPVVGHRKEDCASLSRENNILLRNIVNSEFGKDATSILNLRCLYSIDLFFFFFFAQPEPGMLRSL